MHRPTLSPKVASSRPVPPPWGGHPLPCTLARVWAANHLLAHSTFWTGSVPGKSLDSDGAGGLGNFASAESPRAEVLGCTLAHTQFYTHTYRRHILCRAYIHSHTALGGAQGFTPLNLFPLPSLLTCTQEETEEERGPVTLPKVTLPVIVGYELEPEESLTPEWASAFPKVPPVEVTISCSVYATDSSKVTSATICITITWRKVSFRDAKSWVQGQLEHGKSRRWKHK